MTEIEVRKPVTVNREDLYKQAWDVPMQRLAAQYGISGNGLAKVCDRLKVPYPPRGYWAKKEAGKPARTLQLPQADADTPADVLITPTPPRLPPPPPPSMSGETQRKYETALAQACGIVVPEKLRRPHPVIADWIAERSRELAARRRDRYSESFGPKPFTEIDHRRHRILNTLFKELEKRSFKVRTERYQSVWLEIGRERVDFSLHERIRQERRPLTPEQSRSPFHSGQRWTQVKIPTGILVFNIGTQLEYGMPNQWADQPERPLEQNITAIIAALSLAGPILKARREAAEDQARARQQLEIERQRLADQKQREKNRWQRFLVLANRWHEIEAARQFLETLKELPKPKEASFGERTHEEWLAWVTDRLAEHDPLRHGADGIWGTLAHVTA